MSGYFLDTYAIVEIIKGNQAYKKYLDSELFTSILNLYELYFNILKELDKEKAQEYFFQFYDFLIPIKNKHIFDASEFKLKRFKFNISYTDALGYAIAQEEGMKFLTGDIKFRGIKNIEFVK